jgi:hypothetical protein
MLQLERRALSVLEFFFIFKIIKHGRSCRQPDLTKSISLLFETPDKIRFK